jgi:hypothetical protein
MRSVVVCLALVLLSSPTLAAQPEDGQKKPLPLERRVLDLEKEVASLKTELGFLKMAPVPDQLSLCEEPIPLSNEEVREAFEREFYQFLERRGLLTILVRRHAKFLAVVSEEIESRKMPPDLIYLAIVESYLNPRAVSSASAGGLWQFIKDTAKREGLFINDQVDERYSVKSSTRSALGYLGKLHAEFGDWLVAMAGYNAGEKRVREVIANQNTRDFFEMFLPQETERYVYRIAAIKEILGNPHKYGLPLQKGDYYRPYAVADVVIDVERETPTAVLAEAMELPYRTFREYNLHIRSYRLPRGVYHLYMPVEKKGVFLGRIKANPAVTVENRADE